MPIGSYRQLQVVYRELQAATGCQQTGSYRQLQVVYRLPTGCLQVVNRYDISSNPMLPRKNIDELNVNNRVSSYPNVTP